ncbi:MAG: hypothetical protein HYX84_09375 [Chloroflexi bacterium]|nr:hypothetical protein [Chloroflexota bacterium]
MDIDVKAGKCKYGCGKTALFGADYVRGHDARHRPQLIDAMGGEKAENARLG